MKGVHYEKIYYGVGSGNNEFEVYHAIVWQCRRTADYVEQLKEEGYTMDGRTV